MRVFLSWSGSRSRHVAAALRDWLLDVMPVVVQPWMSETDIGAGKRWGREIESQLAETTFGIICLTASNQAAPWILFEAGALAKSVSEAHVCPYLIDFEIKDLVAGPLTQFQAKVADKKGTLSLLLSINALLGNHAFDESWLERHFERWWPDLYAILKEVPTEERPTPLPRSPDDMVAEILEITRRLDANGGVSDGGLPAPTLRTQAPRRRREVGHATLIDVGYEAVDGSIHVASIQISAEATVFDALTAIWHRLKDPASSVQPKAFTYLWDWILIRRTDGRPLVVGGLVYTLPASSVFATSPEWLVQKLDLPLVNDSHTLGIVRGTLQV